MQTTSTNLMRWAGLAAIGAGSLFVLIQPIHPLDELASVTTTPWAIAHTMGIVMGLLGLLGITGLYARQAKATGWLGLAGYLLLTLFYALTLAFQFIETLIIPQLVDIAPQFVEGFLGIASGYPSEVNLGVLPTVYTITGLAGYMLGGLLFGIATFRAAILPRWAGALLAVGVVLPLVTAGLVPHPFDRVWALPVGVAVAWLGYALWTERHLPAGEAAQGMQNSAQSTQMRPATAK